VLKTCGVRLPTLHTVGVKSYGRAPTFLLLTGYEQVRSVSAAIAGDWDAAQHRARPARDCRLQYKRKRREGLVVRQRLGETHGLARVGQDLLVPVLNFTRALCEAAPAGPPENPCCSPVEQSTCCDATEIRPAVQPRTQQHRPDATPADRSAALTPAGISALTTLPEPMIDPSPIVTPGFRWAAAPIHSLRPILAGFANNLPRPFCWGRSRGWTCICSREGRITNCRDVDATTDEHDAIEVGVEAVPDVDVAPNLQRKVGSNGTFEPTAPKSRLRMPSH
jgi:hypothetical protein